MSSLYSTQRKRLHHKGGENFQRVLRVLQETPMETHSFGVSLSPELAYEVPPTLNAQVVALLKDLAELETRHRRKPYSFPPSGSS
jgi:hypothetical protein